MLRIPPKFDADFVSATFYCKEFNTGRLDYINQGRCYDWAYYAKRTFHVSNIVLWSTYYHAYVEFEGKFFDSESPQGVKDFLKLKTNQRFEGVSIKQSIPEFTSWWDNRGGGQRRHWDSILEKNIQNTLGFSYIPKIKPEFMDPFIC